MIATNRFATFQAQTADALMSLKVELKPGERLIIGDCLITNSDQRTRLFVDGAAPILREKDILTADTANSPAKRIYFAVQLMYLDGISDDLQHTFEELTTEITQAAPSTIPYIDQINNEILTGSLYKSLKRARELIAYEGELLAKLQSGGTDLSTGRQKHE